ncbi:MAG: GNAT family N-acetyltransferase, partial [Crenarchaeota archaeon]|nr:GNAT family N-acetyltransferase [Thermoproteota archaeon]
MLPAGYLIRLAQEADLDQIAHIEFEAAELFEPYGLKELCQQPTPIELLINGIKNQCCWVVIDSRNFPVGFTLTSLLGKIGHIEEIVVLPEHGRKGLGTALLNTIDKWANSKSLETVVLTTFSHIPWNAPYYLKKGFKIL